MHRFHPILVLLTMLLSWTSSNVAVNTAAGAQSNDSLRVGFSTVDITPDLQSGQPVWIAGYDWDRAATGVHDRLFARCVLFSQADRLIALVSVDLIGMQLPDVKRIRSELPDIDFLHVTSTHNHEGPDIIGIWGKTPVHRGVNEQYLANLRKQIKQCVSLAKADLTECDLRYGIASDPDLLRDSRQPIVKDSILRVLQFVEAGKTNTIGLLVQWNCHPECLGSDNTLLTSDFPRSTIATLQRTHNCPIVYVTGTVGGLMAPPSGVVRDEDNALTYEGEFRFADAYGKAVAGLTEAALADSVPVRETPLTFAVESFAIPIDNPLYRTASLLRVIKRPSLLWSGDPTRLVAMPAAPAEDARYATATEVSCIQIGEVTLVGIPGEIYPELVYGKFQEPVESNVDFPEAPLEPTVDRMMASRKWMLLGLANDEIGYIIPKRQWDQQPPFAYGRKKSQYGEINSCGPETAPLVMEALQRCIRKIHGVPPATLP